MINLHLVRKNLPTPPATILALNRSEPADIGLVVSPQVEEGNFRAAG